MTFPRATTISSRPKVRILLALVLVMASCVLFSNAPAQADTPEVTGVRAGINGEATRFVLELSEAVDFEVFTLDNPDRVVVDLETVDWSLPADNHRLDTGTITSLRYGDFDAERSRIVLDVLGPVVVRAAFLLEPSSGFGYRFVLDLEPRAPDEVVEASLADPATVIDAIVWDGPPLPAIKPEPTVYIIAIDAGHGGVDPGAIGASGTFEKQVTLIAAQDLKRLLEATGNYHVVLTRDDDEFLRLSDRVTLARAAEADLFISIHADSIDDPSVRGAGVYTLSETASDKEAEALASQENKADLIEGVDFINIAYDPVTTNILIDLAQRGTTNASSEFAELLTDELNDTVTIRGNAHRFAGFRVLKAPDVPSILLEMGYMSNPQEERNMLDAAYRERFMGAVVDAVDAFFATRAP
ncbi:MAG: N-acetylmuramoyl-L-alanine amidase [Alphaproteobacteria bacterium]|jgi:N-acetylmuramoyl-L-alanine amidase|nr:N-acetylmuramoyl-L-alanine amidase [Rhodospirillaceae bacterium]MDG2482234.1 N-acetylmuramoyl-L-alanine amidase [Alphaproteobacteria bacterium]MBT6203924.1 N-acetylmuramoyl-L-alanine amidase [Rhodospirillaceae bacterium]MBT6508934.1 N-acetylmuramoyl-L-alanine amidase [Rhodospirillaceae bacterium]MBT7611878.1 N-acetylmuramoyl-L-alanine amidase [Rhodospirillaceae bacterium]